MYFDGIVPRESVLNITAVKPIDGFARRWDGIISRASRYLQDPLPTSKPLRIAIVGAGAGGCELCMAVHSRFSTLIRVHNSSRTVEVVLISKANTLLSSLSNVHVQRMIKTVMREKGVTVHLGVEIVGVAREADECFLVGLRGQRIPYDEAIWCTQVRLSCGSVYVCSCVYVYMRE